MFSRIFFQNSFDFNFLSLGLDLAEIWFCLWHKVLEPLFYIFSKQVIIL